MISKKYRLTRPQFLLAKRLGKTKVFPEFSAVSYPHQGYSRYSVVISSKLIKKAVIRNRLRRNLYDNLRTMNFEPYADIIFYPKTPMLNFSHAQIGTLLNSALSKLFT